jgi:imidazolonepropionase-like amidohydrolase
MLRERASFPLSGLAPALALTLIASAATAEVTAFVGATVHPVTAPPIEDAVLLVENGRIAALGRGLALPAGAEVVELTGKHIYPGFVHPASTLGLQEISSVRGTMDVSETGEVNPSLRSEVAFNADSLLLPVAISGGVLSAHVSMRGGLLSGTSAVLSLDGWNWEEMTLAAPVGMHLNFPRFTPARGWRGSESEEEAKKRRERQLEELEEIFEDARAYARAREAAAAGRAPAPRHNRHLEALLPLLSGELPLFLHAEERTQIAAALDWARDQGFGNLVLIAGPDVRYHAERLARDGIPVILDGVHRLPARRWEPYDEPFAAAARLHEAGVLFAIGDGFGASNARNLPFHAATAVALGLPPEAALEAITVRPAEILGVGDRLGSLEPGKDATFFVSDGDPLQTRTRIEAAWIGGREYDLSRDHQRRLYDRYDNRPAPGGE